MQHLVLQVDLKSEIWMQQEVLQVHTYTREYLNLQHVVLHQNPRPQLSLYLQHEVLHLKCKASTCTHWLCPTQLGTLFFLGNASCVP